MRPLIRLFTAEHPFMFILKNTNNNDNDSPIFIGALRKLY